MEVTTSVLDDAAKRFGLEGDGLGLLGGMDSRMYVVPRLVDGREVLLRLSMVRDDRMESLFQQYEFIAYLAGGGVGVSSPLPSLGGRLVETVPSGKEGESYAVVLMEKAPGRHVDVRNDDEFAPPLFVEWGRTMGRLHRLSKAYRGGTSIMGWRDEVNSMKSMCHDEAVLGRWVDIETRLCSFPAGPDDIGLIHNDMHPWNYYVRDGRITLFDFDVMGRHWFALDVAIALHSGLWSRRPGAHSEFAPYFLEHFMTGYNEENTLDPRWLDGIHFFLNYRHTLLYTVGCVEADHRDSWFRQLMDGTPFGIASVA